MIIKDIHISGFGKLHNKDFTFNSGLNIIYGHNEAGKSTLHSFIFHMLYGLNRARGRASRFDAYSRYCPWDYPDSFGGSMRILVDNVPYLIERSFNTSNKYLSVTNEQTGEVVQNDEAYLNRLIGGISENAFNNTLYIPQSGAVTGDDMVKLLKKRVLNVSTASSFNIDATLALKSLTAKKKALASETHTEAAKEYYETLERIETITSALESRRLALAKLQTNPASEIKALEYEIEQLNKKIDPLTIEYEELNNRLKNKAPESLSDTKKPFNRLWINGLLFALCLIISIILFAANQTAFGIILLVIAVVFVIFTAIPFLKQAKSIDNSIDANDKALPFINYNGCLRADFSRLEKIKAEIDTYKNNRATARETLLSIKNSTLDNAKSLWEIDKLQQELDSLEDERTRLDCVIEENNKLGQEIKSIELAIDTINKISSSVHTEYAPKLNKRVSEIFSTITNNKHGELLISESLEIILNNKNRTIPSESLSFGTIEQIYLSLRLSAADILFDKNTLPLMLDEVFAMYDNGRLAQTLKYISEECASQTFLFSCQNREYLIAEKINVPFTCIKL